VFAATHRLVLDLTREGKVTGLRVDHAILIKHMVLIGNARTVPGPRAAWPLDVLYFA
jgi:hypothetical protein